MFQFRDIAAPVSVFYSPGRDLAHVGFFLIEDGLDFLDFTVRSGNQQFIALMDRLGITREELDEAIKAFVESLEEEVKNESEDMLKENSFSAVRPEVRYLIYSCIAPIFIGATIKGKKDVLTRADAVEYYGETFRKKILGFTRDFYPIRLTLTDYCIRGLRQLSAIVLRRIKYFIALIKKYAMLAGQIWW